MTNEEAIEFLSDIKTDAIYSITSEEKCALDVAIKALEERSELLKRLETKETVAKLLDSTISMLSSDKDTLVDKMNNKDKEYQAKVQKCVERIEKEIEWYKEHGQNDLFRKGIIGGCSNTIRIIKEELGVEE